MTPGLSERDIDKASVARADVSVPAVEKVVDNNVEPGEADDNVANDGWGCVVFCCFGCILFGYGGNLGKVDDGEILFC